MRRILWLAPILALPASSIHAEMMHTSYYRAKAPHIAAHRTLPFGTWLIITNPRNGRSTAVVIGTRGPFIPGRHLDISREFARNLDVEQSGVAWLKTRIVETDDAEAHQPHRTMGASE